MRDRRYVSEDLRQRYRLYELMRFNDGSWTWSSGDCCEWGLIKTAMTSFACHFEIYRWLTDLRHLISPFQLSSNTIICGKHFHAMNQIIGLHDRVDMDKAATGPTGKSTTYAELL